jgi:hypothetical protein
VIGAATAAARRRLDLIDAVLLTGLLLNLAAYLAGVQAVNITSTREIAPVLALAAVLAGRQLGGRLAAGRGRAAAALRLGLCAVLAGYGAMVGYDAAQPPSPPQYAGLAAWLPAEHLTDGLSGYHQANIVTLETGGAVTLRAVRPASGGLTRVHLECVRHLVRSGRAPGEFPGAHRTGRARRRGRRGADGRRGDGDVRPSRQDRPVRRVRDPDMAAGRESARPAPLAARVVPLC